MKKLKPVLKTLNQISFNKNDMAILPMINEKGERVEASLIDIIARATLDYDPETEKAILRNGVFDSLGIQNIMIVKK